MIFCNRGLYLAVEVGSNTEIRESSSRFPQIVNIITSDSKESHTLVSRYSHLNRVLCVDSSSQGFHGLVCSNFVVENCTVILLWYCKNFLFSVMFFKIKLFKLLGLFNLLK